MALPSSYKVGTVSVSANSAVVTGVGTNWTAAGIRADDLFAARGLSVSIASIDSATQITLAEPWRGTNITDQPYEVRFVSDTSRVLAAARTVISLLDNFEFEALFSAPSFTFATREEAQGSFIPAPVTRIRVGSLRYVRDASGTALTTGASAKWSPDGTAVPDHFGAVGNGTTDDTAPVQLWVNWLRSKKDTGEVPAKTYLVTTIDAHPSSTFGMRGAGDRQSIFKIRNPSRSAVGIKFTHPTTPSTRGQPYSFEDVGVEAEDGTKACLVEHRYCSAAKWSRVRIRGYHGATGLRMEKCWNVDLNEVSVWGCGHNVVAKRVPDGTTFSIETGASPIVASQNVFSAADVGRRITLASSSSTTPQTFLITGYTNAKTVSVSQPRKAVYDSVPGSFGGVRGSMEAGSSTLTLEANVLTSDDVGRKVYVMGAYKRSFENNKLPLPARIVAVNGASITLDAAAVLAVSNAQLVFDPAVDFGDADFSVIQKTNDFKCADLHVEHHRGCGLVVTGVTLGFRQMKLHAVGHEAMNEEATNIQMVAYNAYGHFSGTLEQVVASNVGRILVTGSDAPLSIGDMETVLTHDSPTVRLEGCEPGAAVSIGVIKGLGTNQTQAAMDTALSTDGSGIILAKLIGAPGQSYRRIDVSLT
jgi:hypothetical protein